MSWIVVGDLEGAIAFFTEKLGLKLSDHQPQFGWAELSSEEEGALLGLAEASTHNGMRPGSNAVVTYSVDNLAKTVEEYRTKGVRLKGEGIEVPGVVKLQSFLAEDGNECQLVEELPGNR